MVIGIMSMISLNAVNPIKMYMQYYFRFLQCIYIEVFYFLPILYFTFFGSDRYGPDHITKLREHAF